MADEIELKLAVSHRYADLFAQEITKFRILDQQTRFLANTYFDTADRYFARHKMGLRVRRERQLFTLTLKTDGNVVGGLHIRPEYNVTLDSARPDLTKLTRFDGLRLPLDLHLQPVFSTDFERTFWLVECGCNSEVEIALDRGVIKAGDKSEEICEVEFELKRGELHELLTLVAELSLTDGVRLSSASKAERGYRLADAAPTKTTDWLAKWREILALENQGAKSRQISTALFRYEQQLIEETVALGADYFARDFLRTVECIGAFFNLYHYYNENPKLLADTLAEKQQNSDQTADEQTITELAESNQRLLEIMKEIIRFHTESKDNHQSMRKLLETLHLRQYANRMIDFIRLTL
ncbi:inorganic triphosphatase [Pasteurellaceae bacterium LIM206]|nr:inorganic triphosphatase [Pasteurellaceae bacterium LIM206]